MKSLMIYLRITSTLYLTWDIPNGCSTTSAVVSHAPKTEVEIAQHSAKCQNLHSLKGINYSDLSSEFPDLAIFHHLK